MKLKDNTPAIDCRVGWFRSFKYNHIPPGPLPATPPAFSAYLHTLNFEAISG